MANSGPYIITVSQRLDGTIDAGETKRSALARICPCAVGGLLGGLFIYQPRPRVLLLYFTNHTTYKLILPLVVRCVTAGTGYLSQQQVTQ